MNVAPDDPTCGRPRGAGHVDDAMLSYKVRAMGDRVALIYDTPDTAYIHELKLDQAAIMLEQLVRAIHEAREIERA